MSFRVLIADKLDKQAVPILVDAGFEVVNKPGMNEDEIAAAIPGFDAVIVRSAAKITAKIIQAADCLKCIGRAGTGVDNIDVKAATAKGILVMNVPGGNTVTAAEHALAMMLSMSRMVPQADASMKADFSHLPALRSPERPLASWDSARSDRLSPTARLDCA